MRLVPAVTAAAAAATALTLAVPAEAGPGAWVATYPVGTGAQHRLAALPEGDVWAVVDHNKVLRSTDAGLTWLPVNPVPAQVDGVPLPGTGPRLGGSSETYVAPVSRSVAFAANGATLSVTRDAGTTWRELPAPRVTRSGFEATDALEHTGRRLWLARTGFEIDGLCPVPARTTPVLSSDDGKRFRRGDIGYRAGQVHELRFATPSRGAALVIDYVYGEPVRRSGSCSITGEARTTSVWLTHDAGRTWRRTHTCRPSCLTMAWSGPMTLLAARVDGGVVVSKDSGRSFRRAPGVPIGPNPLAFLQALDCASQSCFASVNGGGLFRNDGLGDAWTREPSGQEAYAPSLGDLAMVDAERGVAGGPNALATRTTTPGAEAGQPARVGGAAPADIGVGQGAVLGLDGALRRTWTLQR